jgi:hypothetical protein
MRCQARPEGFADLFGDLTDMAVLYHHRAAVEQDAEPWLAASRLNGTTPSRIACAVTIR